MNSLNCAESGFIGSSDLGQFAVLSRQESVGKVAVLATTVESENLMIMVDRWKGLLKYHSWALPQGSFLL